MPQSLLQPLDLYCERLAPGLLAEPVNLLTNLAFVIAGLWGVAAVRRSSGDAWSQVLGWWVVAIGIGSSLFHAFAIELTKWLDILPIAAFTLAYTLFNLRRFLGHGWPKAIAIFVAFYGATGLLGAMVPAWLREATNGSTGYLPPFLALVFFGWLSLRAGNPAGWYNIAAACLFVGSVTFRMIDPIVCPSFPLGTHFLWHVMNGVMLGVILSAVAAHGAPSRRQAGLARSVA